MGAKYCISSVIRTSLRICFTQVRAQYVRSSCYKKYLFQRGRAHFMGIMSTSSSPITVVSFDVDGTLIHSVGTEANKLHKAAFSYGFKAVFGLDTHIDVIAHHGSTDPLIIIKVLEHHGISKAEAMAKLPAVQREMEQYFLSHMDQAAVGLELLPGVTALLTELKALPQATTCLVTGNLEPIGWGKMEKLGILDLFSTPRFGGFGSDFCSGNTDETWRDRGEFVRIAARKCEETHGLVGTRFHVGDTPMDIQAALDAGAVPIGVATGIYSREQLEAVAPHESVVVLDSLADLPFVLQKLG
ncbi:hypothetical protein VaNZ11_002094, partial [Volvox africanus]